jgi:hypothetical protein
VHFAARATRLRMNSNAARVILLCLPLFACGARQGSPMVAVADQRPDEVVVVPEVVRGDVAEAVVYPLPRAHFIEQGLPLMSHPSMHALDDGRIAFVGSEVYAIVANGAIVNRTALPPFDEWAFRALDAAGRRLVVASAFVDLVSGVVRPNPPGRRYAECDAALERCTTIEPSTNGAWLRVRREALVSGEEIAAFEIPNVHRRPAPIDEETRGHAERAFVAGDVLSIGMFTEPSNVLVTYDMRTRAVLAHREIPEWTTRVDFGHEETEDDIATSASGETVVRGVDGSARVTRTGVRFLAADGTERGVASFAPAPEPPHTEDTSWGAIVLGSSVIHLWHDELGLATIRPGDTTLRYAPAIHDPGPVWLHAPERAFSFSFADTLVALGPDGVVLTEDEEGSGGAMSERARTEVRLRERAGALFPTSINLLTIAAPERHTGTFAFVWRGHVHLTDEAGHDVAPPVRLPGDVARSHCTTLEIVTDEDLVLSGSRPCIPTRIRYREGRTEPLGLARVRASSSSDGAHVALLANRRVLVLDGHTGATLHDLDPQLLHAREIEITADGREVHLFSEDAHVAIRLAGIAQGATPTMRRYDRADSFVTRHDARVLFCEDGALHITQAFDATHDVRVPFAPCLRGGVDEWRTLPGFVVAKTAVDRLALVRIRDGARLEIEMVGGYAGTAVLVMRDGDVVGVMPANTPSLMLRSADGTGVELLPTNSRADEVVRAFFATQQPSSP